jgi:glycosyltransferase involved in cell wall biosynthesis
MSPTALPAPRAAREALETGARGVRIGVVVPAYRVAGEIERVLRGIPPFVEKVIVVDDASPDDTAARVERSRDPRVVLVRHAENRGVGGASTSGFAEALRLGMDVVVKMDGDDQMDPEELPRLLAPVLDGTADVAKGNRYASIDSLRAMPPIRIVGNAILTFLVKLASGYWNVFDPANGYLALRADLLRRLDLERLPRRYFFESGLLIELGILRAVVADVPIPARYGGERSSLSIPRTVLGFPPRLLWGLLRRFFWRYLVHDFSALSVFTLMGAPLLLWGLAYGTRAYLHMLATGVPATAGMVMLSAMPILLGVQLLLQAVVLDVQNVPTRPITPPPA